MLDAVVLKFVQLLRQAGIRVSATEVSDALEALQYVPLMDRRIVKGLLRATLIKDERSLSLFDSAFASFFRPQEQRQHAVETYRGEQDQEQECLHQAELELSFQGQSLDLPKEDLLVYAHLDQIQKQRLRDFLARTSNGKNVERDFQPVVERLVRGHLAHWRQRMGGAEQVIDVNSSGDEELDALLAEALKDLSSYQARMVYQDMQSIRPEDLPLAARLIQRLSRRLATRLSRRYRRSVKHAMVDLRRTIRFNLRHGGTPVALKYRNHRIQKPRLLVLCDVSGSMARYSSFVLQFLLGLSSSLQNIDSFLFSEDLEPAPERLLRAACFHDTLSELIEKSRVWGEGTNIYRSLSRLAHDFPGLVSRRTVLIIVSDTKSLQAVEAGRMLRDFRRRVREVIWLNTLPRRDWERFPTVRVFGSVSRMFECNTLAQLEQILRQQLLPR